MLPFDNVKILDFSRQAPGPFATMVLSDFGAEVIAIEPPPGVADQLVAPFTARAIKDRRHNAIYRNKRSIVLDLKREEGREVIRRMAAGADVVVEGFRPGVVDRLGIGWDALRAINPGLVYCSVSGYGQTGPDRLTAGHDIDYLARGGALAMFARPGEAPVPPLNVLGDYGGGGLLAAFSIAAALAAKSRSGEGQYIDVSMTDGVAYLMAAIYAEHFAGVGNRAMMPRYSGNQLPFYNVYGTKDGRWVALGAEEAHFWRALCDGFRRPDLLPLQHDATRRAWVIGEVEREIGSRTVAQLRRLFRGKDVCLEVALKPSETVRSELFRARDLVVEAPSADGPARMIGVGPKLSATPGRVTAAAPVPGEHTRALLDEAGYSKAECESLISTGVTLAAPARRKQ